MIQQSFEFAEYDDAADDPDFDDVEAWLDEPAELADVLRDALSDDYADSSPEAMDDALENVLASMSPAESFNFAKALRQIETGARQALSDPVVGQVVRTALPIAGGAAGTVIGGPVGAALGSSLGNAAAAALPGGPKTRPAIATPSTPAPATPPMIPAVAGGSAAAAQGLVLTQQPDVLKGLLALAMGQHGQKSVNGVPVAQIMGMLSSVFGEAAADADELMYRDDEGFGDNVSFPDESASPAGRGVYATLLDAENDDLAEAGWWS